MANRTERALLVLLLVGVSFTAEFPSIREVARNAQKAVLTVTVTRCPLRVIGKKVLDLAYPFPIMKTVPESLDLALTIASLPLRPTQKTVGSAFIISEDGLALTNYHVISNHGSIKVEMSDGSKAEVDVLGVDKNADLALLRVKGEGPFPYLRLGDSAKLEAGDWLIAIGTPLGLRGTVTTGVVSARARTLGILEVEDFIQTDASLNFGNSGGPLINLSGEAVGIATAGVIFSQNINFFIPIDIAKDAIPSLKEGKKPSRGWLGVRVRDAPDGAKVREVLFPSPARKAGIRKGDIIYRLNNTEIKSAEDLFSAVIFSEPGSTATLQLRRDGKRLKVSVILVRRQKQFKLF